MTTYKYGSQENEDDELQKRLSQYGYEQAGNSNVLESDTVRQAQEMLNQQISKPGQKTSGWQSQLNDTINRILNRENFSYDLNGDALYQLYKDNYMTQGKMAMMDTMGQAAMLTGGYGNSYAQGVGQQAYHGYLQQLNDRVPDLYQLALSKYQMDGDQLQDQAALLSQMDRYQTADKQWQDEFDEAKWRFDTEWEKKYGEKPNRGGSEEETTEGDNGEEATDDDLGYVGGKDSGNTGYVNDAAQKLGDSIKAGLVESMNGGPGAKLSDAGEMFLKNLPYPHAGSNIDTWKQTVLDRLTNSGLSNEDREEIAYRLGL